MNTVGNHNDLQSDTALLQTEDDSVGKNKTNLSNLQGKAEISSESREEIKLSITPKEDRAY